MQEVTVEGYRTLGIVSTFIAGVESQCIGLVSDLPDHPKISEAASALLLIGLTLSSFGAALSLLSARWFDLLRGNQLVMLEYRWECARNNKKRADIEAQIPIPPEIREEVEKYKDRRYRLSKDYAVAKAVSLAPPFVFAGFYTFIIAMVLYTWAAHSLTASIVNTFVAALGTILVVCMHLDFDFMGSLQDMSFKRPRI
ncbi:hypothetical protein RSOLAG1IB_05182 [Rhizoctonia solani AG-1 IB]|uniref:Uncharacterized protein n=1 Tax=Thanatephorus cucumeris (strain AG1-IB / isolate 7/3/14) TaxID=1108050 RepID=A0A0B7G3X0_THACB|nr:hypothetical protein RSOLAG1IB_05182 [Rhizoctonia solani AG-1 IB]